MSCPNGTGAPGNRDITITPVGNFAGTTSIKIKVIDGLLSDEKTVIVNVAAVNDPPVFSGVADINFNEDGTGTLSGVNVTDADGDPVALSATSGNTAIVANNAITVTPASAASGTPRSIQVTGLPNKNGTVQITLSADDGHGGVVTANFNAIITAVPDAPILTGLVDRFIAEDTLSPDYVFTIIDPDGDAITTVTATSYDNLVPTANVTITAQGGGNYILRASPRPNDSGRYAVIRVFATDATNLLNSAVFNLNVTPVPDAPIFLTSPPTQTIVKNSTTGPVAFTSFDGDCAATAVPSAVSTNTTLVPNTAANISVRALGITALCGQPTNVGIIGMTATHEIIITPTANLTGVALINGTVTDNTGLKVTRPVTIMVNFTNKAPEFLPLDNELVDTTILEDGSANLNFFVQDLDGDPIVATASSSNPTLLPPGALVVNGTNGSRSLTIVPAANINGTALVTVSLSDGISVTTRSFLLTVLPVNDAPTISAVIDQTLAFNANTGQLPFTIGDIETSANQLQLSVASSDPNVIPVGNIALNGSGANRTVVVTSGIVGGSSTISITVSDGVSTTVESFVVDVVGNNLPPTMSQIADQNIPRNGSVGPLAFTVGDDLLPPGSLTVTFVTDNQGLLPNSGGSGASRTIRITPATNIGGSGRITLTVTDGVYNTRRSFLVSVPTVGAPPQISQIFPPNGDNKLKAGVASGQFTFTVSDADTPLDELVLSIISSNPAVIPVANVVFGGSGANRFLVITPARAQAGDVTLTIVVRDNSNVASSPFRVIVWRDIFLVGAIRDYNPFNIEASEPNNTYARAMLVVPGVEYMGKVYSNSVNVQDTIDVLSLSLSAGKYRITLSFTGADLDMYLRGPAPSFATLAKSDLTGNTGPEVINYTETAAVPTLRYIVINFYSGGVGDKEYRVKIEKLP